MVGINTDHQIGDGFTKPLPHEKHWYVFSRCGLLRSVGGAPRGICGAVAEGREAGFVAAWRPSGQ